MRILIVHADPAMGATLKTAASKLGHKVQWLREPEGVISHLHGNDVDALLMAVELPGSSGPDLYFAIEEAYLAKPVGFVSSADVDKRLLARATLRGPLLPRVWAKSDLKELIGELERRSKDVSHMQVVQARIGTKTEETPAIPYSLVPPGPGGPLSSPPPFSGEGAGERTAVDPSRVAAAQMDHGLVDFTNVDPVLVARSRGTSTGVDHTNVEMTDVERTDVEPSRVEHTEVAQGTEVAGTPLEQTNVERTFVGIEEEHESSDSTLVDPSAPKAEVGSLDQLVPVDLPPPPSLEQPPTRDKPKVRIVCTQWDQVQGLCGDIRRGVTCITVRARAQLDVEQLVTMQIALPDEMVITVDGLVVGSSPWEPDGKRPYQIDLVGFGSDQLFFLQSKCDQLMRPGSLGKSTQPIRKVQNTPDSRATRPIRGGKKS